MTVETGRGRHILRTEVAGHCEPDVHAENLALLKEQQVLFFVEPLATWSQVLREILGNSKIIHLSRCVHVFT